MGDFVPLTGDPLAIDLINTRALLPGVGWVDAMETLAGLRLWLGLQQERLDMGGGRLSRSDLAAVHQLRDDAADAVARARKGRRPSAETLRRLNQALQAAPSVGKLRWTVDGIVHESTRPSGAGGRLRAQLAEATAELLADPRVREVRDCAMPDCVMLFYPTHPSRKWCSDAICGNRARVARHYQRQKASREVAHAPG